MQTEMPENYADTDGDIEGMFGTELGDFQTKVTFIDHILSHSIDLISEHNCIFHPGLRNKCIKHDRLCGLLCRHNDIPFFFQTADSLEGVICMFPLNTVLRTQGGFVNFRRRRDGTDSAEPKFVGLE